MSKPPQSKALEFFSAKRDGVGFVLMTSSRVLIERHLAFEVCRFPSCLVGPAQRNVLTLSALQHMQKNSNFLQGPADRIPDQWISTQLSAVASPLGGARLARDSSRHGSFVCRGRVEGGGERRGRARGREPPKNSRHIVNGQMPQVKATALQAVCFMLPKSAIASLQLGRGNFQTRVRSFDGCRTPISFCSACPKIRAL